MRGGPTWTEEHRKQCEIRWVLTLTKPARAEIYGKVAKARGEATARALMAEVSAEWVRRSASRSPVSR